MDHAGTHHGSGTGFGPPVGEPAIEAQGLGKKYRRGWALRDVSFRPLYRAGLRTRRPERQPARAP